MGFPSYSCMIGRTFVRQRSFLLPFERNQHFRGEWVGKGIEPGIPHDEVKITQGCTHDLERTFSQWSLTRQVNLDTIGISLGMNLAAQAISMKGK